MLAPICADKFQRSADAGVGQPFFVGTPPAQ